MKQFLLSAMLTVCSVAVHAQNWRDVTDNYVTNPSFDGSANGWVINYNGSTAQNYGYQPMNYRYYDNETMELVYISNFAEAWRDKNNGRGLLGNGSIHQALNNIPSGHYRLEADLIATDQSNRNNPVSGFFLFIADEEKESTTAVATNDNQPRHFSVEMETTQNSITIGAKTVNPNGNWLAMDNIKLYWYGEEVVATGLTLNPKTKSLTIGESFVLTAILTPENATFKRLKWSSDDEAIASVDENGVVTANAAGVTTIRCATVNNARELATTCRVTVERSNATADQLVINEIQVSNVDMFMDPSFNYGGWIEIYNPTDKNASVSGYYLSDDPANLKKAIIGSRSGFLPAKGYLVLWLDHYSRWAPTMVDFKLDCDGGMVYISDETGTIITSCIYPPAISRTSYARTTDGSKQWGTTNHPTPGRSNNDASFSVARLEAPVISHPGGMIDGNVSAQVTIPDGATLRYTTDGSTPTLDNGSTSTDGRFDISETTVLRLRLFKDGMLSSPVVTRSFIMRDRNYTLPIVSIVTDDKHIYSQEYGIFVRGVNGRPGNGQSGACNWNMDWERPINFEYFTEDGQAAFNMEVGMEAAGGWSRAWEPHSSNIKANKRYEGLNKMDYPFFSDRPFIREKAIKLRNGGNDTNCRLKDPALQRVVRTSGLYIETQGWNPVHEFINGHYIGVLNMREPNSKNYGYAVYGLDTDNMDQWKMSPDSGYVQQAGTRDAWEELLSLSSDAADEDTYEQIKQLLDIEEFINYLSVEMYIGAVDWPQNNVKAFRDRNNGRFRFVLFDTDNALSSSNSFNDFTNKQVKTFDQLYGVSDLYPSGRLTLEIEMVTLYLNLLKNATFKKQFIDQFCIVAGSVFEPERAAKVINEMVAHVAPGLELEGHSPNSMANEVRNALSSSRQTQMVSSLRSYMGLRTPQNVTLSSDNENARLFINDLPVPTGKFGGQLFAPITIKATAPAGQRFVGWYGRSTSMGNAVFAMGSQWTYYDQGSLDNEDWTAANYNSAQWKQGQAPLGYNTPDENNERGYQTFLDYGSDVNNKYPTYYFRRQFEITKAKASDQYTLDWVADDGFVIYVNGVEAGRYLMNNTPRPQFGSYADSWSPDNPQSGNMTLDASLFHEGTNTIAVELHNNSASSTDIYWDASLLRLTDALGGLVSTDAEYTLPTSGSVTLVASFEPIPDEELAKSDVHPVKINEISASNDIYINDYQKKNDWIELYNTTSAPIDVAGMYISDNLDKPEKVQISAEGSNASTIIPAHGFLIIWADKLENKDQLHVDFKLAAESGDVVLTAADKSWADTLSYGPHSAQQTVGLYPDGGSMVYVFEQPTINKPNMMSMYAAIWDEPRYDDSTGGIGRVRMDDSQPDNIIFDMTGRRVGTTGSNRKLPHGIYITNRRKILK